ncbi:hypothetical protein [Fulvivirga ulvae]|nr:hypothetical protein [Fulvivirga ulvae]
MITLKRTDSTNADFVALVKLLDADLKVRDGEEHDFTTSSIKLIILKMWW